MKRRPRHGGARACPPSCTCGRHVHSGPGGLGPGGAPGVRVQVILSGTTVDQIQSIFPGEKIGPAVRRVIEAWILYEESRRGVDNSNSRT